MRLQTTEVGSFFFSFGTWAEINKKKGEDILSDKSLCVRLNLLPLVALRCFASFYTKLTLSLLMYTSMYIQNCLKIKMAFPPLEEMEFILV